jgi:hypothetical protein
MLLKESAITGNHGPVLQEAQMKSVLATAKTTTEAQAKNLLPDKAVKVLASSIFRHLQSEGCNPKDIISVSSQLLSLVTTELQKDALDNH